MTHDPQVVQYVTPTTGSTVTCNSGYANLYLLVDPAGAILALTVDLPSTPSDGQIVAIGVSQAITTLTLGNGTIIGTLTTMALGAFAHFMYSAGASKWFRVG